MPPEDKPKTAMKLVCQGPEERVVGLHVIGMGADEMLQVGTMLPPSRLSTHHAPRSSEYYPFLRPPLDLPPYVPMSVNVWYGLNPGFRGSCQDAGH